MNESAEEVRSHRLVRDAKKRQTPKSGATAARSGGSYFDEARYLLSLFTTYYEHVSNPCRAIHHGNSIDAMGTARGKAKNVKTSRATYTAKRSGLLDKPKLLQRSKILNQKTSRHPSSLLHCSLSERSTLALLHTRNRSIVQ